MLHNSGSGKLSCKFTQNYRVALQMGMKISRIKLENFKRFEKLEIEVKNNLLQEVADQFLLLGDNGMGKTTVLQAIALCLSLASGQTKGIDDFNWQGWLSGRYQQWGEPTIELDVHFTQDEIIATRKAAELFYNNARLRDGKWLDVALVPGDNTKVTLRLESGKLTAICPSNNGILQFQGKSYASQLAKVSPIARDLLSVLPDVYWFDQFRNVSTKFPENASVIALNENRTASDVSKIRKNLIMWWIIHVSGVSNGKDWFVELENSYKKIFPDRFFAPPEPMYNNGTPTAEDYYFLLSDGRRTYDIEEMSSGEQSIFRILYEFVRMQIRNSVVLIDEIDLNLHPPLAQAFLMSLPQIGPNCQFIYTTHSEAISTLVSREEIYRLPGGRLCL